jgi:hypothetical protein
LQKSAIVPFAIAGFLVTALVAGILLNARRHRMDLDGEILKVRTHQMDPGQTIAVMDIRLHNPTQQEFIVRDVQVFVDDPNEQVTELDRFAELDAMRIFEYYPILGKKYNASLMARDRIGPGETIDRMIAVGLKRSDVATANRKQFRIVITEIDRAKVEIVEKRQTTALPPFIHYFNGIDQGVIHDRNESERQLALSGGFQALEDSVDGAQRSPGFLQNIEIL